MSIKGAFQEFTRYLDWQTKQQIYKCLQIANADNKGHAIYDVGSTNSHRSHNKFQRWQTTRTKSIQNYNVPNPGYRVRENEEINKESEKEK